MTDACSPARPLRKLSGLIGQGVQSGTIGDLDAPACGCYSAACGELLHLATDDLAGGTEFHSKCLVGRIETLPGLGQLEQLAGEAFVDALEGHVFHQFHEARDA